MNTSALHVVFGTGQVGSQLVDRLLARGYRVRTVRRSAEASRHPMHEGTRVRRPGCSFRSTFRISPSATFAKAARTVGGWWVPSVPSAATTHPSEGWVT